MLFHRTGKISRTSLHDELNVQASVFYAHARHYDTSLQAALIGPTFQLRSIPGWSTESIATCHFTAI
jgi:hypothetical protein